MNITAFTVEEENLICAYSAYDRGAAINGICAAIAEFEESEMRYIAESVLDKLYTMTDAQFSALTFHPAYYNDDDEQEAYPYAV